MEQDLKFRRICGSIVDKLKEYFTDTAVFKNFTQGLPAFGQKFFGSPANPASIVCSDSR